MELLITDYLIIDPALGAGNYILDFGNLFMGRQLTSKLSALKLITIKHSTGSPTIPFSMRFEVSIADTAFTAINPDINTNTTRVAPSPSIGTVPVGIIPAEGVAQVSVNLLNKQWGGQGVDEEPVITIRFPEIVNNLVLQQAPHNLLTELKIKVRWYNYIVIANPDTDGTLKLTSAGNFGKYQIQSVIESGTIPQGEYLPMEVLVDDDFQIPTPITKYAGDYTIISTGDWYNQITNHRIDGDQPDPGVGYSQYIEPVKKGKQGVIVHFDSTAGDLIAGAMSTLSSFWVYRFDLDGVVKPQIDYNFGEHSSRGIYSLYSPYLIVGDLHQPLTFGIYGIASVIDDSDPLKINPKIKVTWYLLKTLDGKPDGNVSIAYSLPAAESTKLNPVHMSYQVRLISKGDALVADTYVLGTIEYTRLPYTGANSFNIVANQIAYNANNVIWEDIIGKTLSISELPPVGTVTVLPPDVDFRYIKFLYNSMNNEVNYILNYTPVDLFSWIDAINNNVTGVHLSISIVSQGKNVGVIPLDGTINTTSAISGLVKLQSGVRDEIYLWLKMDVDGIVDPANTDYYFPVRYSLLGKKVLSLTNVIFTLYDTREWTNVSPEAIVTDQLIVDFNGNLQVYYSLTAGYYATGTIVAGMGNTSKIGTLAEPITESLVAYADVIHSNRILMDTTGKFTILALGGLVFANAYFIKPVDRTVYLEKSFGRLSIRYNESTDRLFIKGMCKNSNDYKTVIGTWNDIKFKGRYDYFEDTFETIIFNFSMSAGQLVAQSTLEIGSMIDTVDEWVELHGNIFI